MMLVPGRRRAVLGGFLLLVAFLLLLVFAPEIRGYYHHLFELRERHSLTFQLLFMGLLILACLTSIFPASVLGVFAGAVFGLARGFALSASSMLIAALVAFLFSRYFFRTVCRRIVNKVIDLDKVDAQLSKDGWRYALLLRLAPIAPFGITSYGLGLTPIRLSHYLLTTLAAFPFLLSCVDLGAVDGFIIGSGSDIDRDTLWKLALIFSSVALTAAVVVFCLLRLARRTLASPRD